MPDPHPASTRRRLLRRLTLGLALAGVLAGGAAAEDIPSGILGSWRVDAAAARAEVLRALEEELTAFPEAERPALRASVLAELERTLREVGLGLDLLPDGAARILTARGPVAAAWTPDEDYVRIERAAPGPDDVALLAFLEGDRLWIEPDDVATDALPIPLSRR